MALTVALVGGAFMVLLPLALKAIHPIPLPAPFPAHNQNTETLLYFASFFALLPTALWAVLELKSRITAATGQAAFSGLVGVLGLALGVATLLARILPEVTSVGNRPSTFIFGLVWSLFTALLLFEASKGRPEQLLAWLADRAGAIWIAAGVSVVCGIGAFVGISDLDRPALIVGLLVGVAVLYAWGRFRLPALGRWGIAVDLVVVLLILLAVPDLVILRPEDAATDPVAAFDTEVMQFHQNLFLGAASQVNAGSALLVDTVSQYGIGSIYLIAAWFQIAPIGHGTLGIFDAFLSAGVFAGGYGVLRMAGVNRLLSAAALTVGVTVLIWGLYYPEGGLLQHGAIRFGLPMPLIVFAIAALRWPRSSKLMDFLALAVIGISSIWALEAFLYVLFTWIGLTAVSAVWMPAGERIRGLLVAAAKAFASIVLVQALFALLTLIASGSLPDWGLYFTYLRDFLAGDIGDLTYDFDAWSPAIAVAGIYVASAAAIVATFVLNRAYFQGHRTAFTALAGNTAYGIVLFSYFDNRSLDHILPYVCLPALLVSTIWLSLILDPGEDGALIGNVQKRWALGLSLLASVAMVANVWPAAGSRFEDSVLAAVPPGGKSLRGGFTRLWNMPQVVPGSDAGVSLIEEYMPDEDETAVITAPDLDVDILVRSDRANSLGITDAKEMSWVPAPHLPVVQEAVDSLEPGDRILMDRKALAAAYRIEQDPASDPYLLADEVGLAAIQTRAIGWVLEEYRLKPIAKGSDGIVVVELESK